METIVRVTEHNEPILAVMPDGREVYFRNKSDVIRRWGLSKKQIDDLLATGEVFQTDNLTYKGKPRKCIEAIGARFKHAIEK